MANEPKLGLSEWTFRIILFSIPITAIVLTILYVTDKLGAYHLWGAAIIFLGLTVLNGKIWPTIGRAFLKYNEHVKMMPHM